MGRPLHIHPLTCVMDRPLHIHPLTCVMGLENLSFNFLDGKSPCRYNVALLVILSSLILAGNLKVVRIENTTLVHVGVKAKGV